MQSCEFFLCFYKHSSKTSKYTLRTVAVTFKSNSSGTFENSQTFSDQIKSDFVFILLFLLVLCLTDGVDPAASVIKCGPGLCMLKALLGCGLTP